MNPARTIPKANANAVNTTTASQPGPTRSKSGFSSRRGSTVVPRTTSKPAPKRSPPSTRAEAGGGRGGTAAPAAAPPRMPVNRMKPIVPCAVISPTTSSASVIRPWAGSPAVTASSRMARRPPAPITQTPAPMPPMSTSEKYQTNRRATSPADGPSIGGGDWNPCPCHRTPRTSPVSSSTPQATMRITRGASPQGVT